MKQGNGTRHKVPASSRSRGAALAGRPNGHADAEMKALEALNGAYRCVSRILTKEIDRSKKDVDRMSDLGGHLRWVAERHKLVRTALKGGPDYAAYLCGDCQELPEVKSLAEMAAKLAHNGKGYPTALNLLSYIDRELGWTPLAKSA